MIIIISYFEIHSIWAILPRIINDIVVFTVLYVKLHIVSSCYYILSEIAIFDTVNVKSRPSVAYSIIMNNRFVTIKHTYAKIKL